MRKLLLFFLLLSLGSMHYARAQGRKVTGKIVNADDGQPIPGVSVKVAGVQREGVLTDGEGNFAIAAAAGQKLIFSYVGFLPQTVDVPVGSFPLVRLRTNSRELTEVVVRDTYGSHSTKAY